MKSEFLLYSPLNQGLKHFANSIVNVIAEEFLLYSPLNQGLKHGKQGVQK